MQTDKRESCSRCLRPKSVCYCHTLSFIEVPQKILIIRDKTEKHHPFNTAVMAKLQLSNLTLVDSDDKNFEQIVEDFIDKNRPYLLFKNHQSKLLSKNILKESNLTNFIAIDGTWDKAKAIYLKIKELQTLPLLHIQPSIDQETIYKDIRKATIKDSLSTLEAIKAALEIAHDSSLDSLLAPLKFTISTQKKFIKN